MASSRTAGVLLAVSGILGIIILTLDKVLRTGAPQHYYALIAFVLIDFLVAATVLTKPRKLTLRIAVGWSTLRILIQLADVGLGPMFQFTYGQFADYLFNPTSALPASLGNPPGIPPIPIDLILLCDVAVLIILSKSSK